MVRSGDVAENVAVGLIENIEKQLKQRRSVQTLFAIQWTLT
jgi:hypothetical protein